MFKRILCLLLACVLALGICACAGETDAPIETTPKAYLKNLAREDVETFPLATADMTKQELRQLCQEFFRLQLSFYWKPDAPVSFQMTNYKKGTIKELPTDTQYAGIVYHSKGFGNVYRWLEYYDTETGILDLSGFIADNGGIGENAAVTDVETDAAGTVTYQKYRSLMALGNQCTSSTCWSWGRAINSVRFGDTCDMNISNGYIPVGCYTYGYTHEGKEYGPLDIRVFGVKSESNPLGYDTPDVIADINKNDPDGLYKCYAQLKPGDLLVNKGHALMVKEVLPYTDSEGAVVYDTSTVVVQEQVEAWNYKGELDGVPFKRQGGLEEPYLFTKLKEEGYIPFTFPELLDENDPQDKKHLDYYHTYADQLVCIKECYQAFPEAVEVSGIGIEETAVYCTNKNSAISAAEFAQMVIGSNYSISDVFVTVTDKNGNELLKNIFRADASYYREVPMTAQHCSWEEGRTISDGIADLANGENTITVTMQLSTGQLLTAYTGTLVN